VGHAGPRPLRRVDANPLECTFSTNGVRVLLQLDTGERIRMALLDVAARRLVGIDQATQVEPSKSGEHVAWLSWPSGAARCGDGSSDCGDELHVDGAKIWGDASGTRSHLDSLAWSSDRELRFYAHEGRKPPRGYVVRIGAHLKAQAAGACDAAP
jgi:hypothetical protein